MLFVFLLFWYVGFVITGRFPRQTQETNTKATQIQHTKKQLNTKKTTKIKQVPHSPWSFVFLFSGLGLRVVPQTRSEGSNAIPRKKHEHAGGSDDLKGMVCHGGADHIYIYMYVAHTFRVYLASFLCIQYKMPS